MAPAPAILLAAPRSGSGKTLLTLGIARALRGRGLEVGAFKVGPDYIDPGFLAAATGRPALNLDSWAMRLPTLADLMGESCGGGVDLALGEGVMGLFDGAPGGGGSTADLAALFALPVVLVVDAAGMGASVAALVEGFARFRADVEVAAIVLNRVAGERHADLLRRALDDRLATPVLGWWPREGGLELPRRHLGLVQAREYGADGLAALLDRAGALAAARLDLGRLLRLARPPALAAAGHVPAPLPPPGARVAVAADDAFAFSYPAVLDGWRRAGAELLPFSPLADEPAPADCDAVYLPGGYPELHAGRLAAGAAFLGSLRAAAARGARVWGECGGYMALGRSLVDREGRAHAMAGLLPVATSFAEPRLHLGYRRAKTLRDGPLGPAGARFRGHEFHYAREVVNEGPPLFVVADARGADLGPAGAAFGTVAGAFLHLVDREDPRAGPRPGADGRVAPAREPA